MIRARLRLFGDSILTTGPDPHTSPVDLPQNVELLLAYLALHPNQPLDRPKLAFVLWPDTTEAAALRNLRQHLHRLRQIVASLELPDETVISAGNQLHFRPDSTLWIDVHQFEQQIANQYRQIEAIELYRGDLLANQSVEWVQPIRARLREQYLVALRNQITIANMQRNYPRALHYASRLLQATPLRESSHRIYMEALYFSGQRVQALQHFEYLKKLLLQSLQTEPMPQTVTLYRQIQSGSLPGDIPPLISSTQQAPETLKTITQISESFVGRRQALAQLDEALARALNGWGRLLLIKGESGLGKTRLLQTWQQARAERMLVFKAQTQAMEAGIPGGPILQALHHNQDQIDWTRFPAHSPWRQMERLLEKFGQDWILDQTDPAIKIGPTVDKLGQFILALARHADRPLGLLIDDLHQADETTWQLAAFLGRRCATVPLLVIGTCRPDALPPTARRLLRSLERHHQLQTIELWPLSPADTTRLAIHLLRHRQEPDKSLTNQLYRLTEGNPFFITEFLKNAEFDDFDQAKPVAGPTPPKTVQAVIDARLNRLSPDSRSLLAVAAAIGRSFNFRVLAGATASHCTENQILEALESWLENGLVVEQSDGYEFKHEQIQFVAYAGLNQDRRQQIHRQVAQTLTTVPLEPHLRHPARLAYHYLHSDRPEQALPHLVASGRRSLSLSSLSEAESIARQSLELLTAVPLDDPLILLKRSLEQALQPPQDLQQAYAILEQIVKQETVGKKSSNP